MIRAHKHWILVRAGAGNQFTAEDVFRLVSTDRALMGDVLLLFTSGETAEAVRAGLASRGLAYDACTLATADEITDLLSRLRDLGTTHVGIDIDPRSPVYRPVASVLLDFQVSG